jgi:hypothetical protein
MKRWRAIRLDAHGQVDDVAISGGLFRMERMDAHLWWVAVYRGDKRVTFWLRARGRITADLGEDGIGCVDDSGAWQEPGGGH